MRTTRRRSFSRCNSTGSYGAELNREPNSIDRVVRSGCSVWSFPTARTRRYFGFLSSRRDSGRIAHGRSACIAALVCRSEKIFRRGRGAHRYQM